MPSMDETAVQCTDQELCQASDEVGSQLTLLSVYGTATELPLPNWASRSRIPDGGVTLITSPKVTLQQEIDKLITRMAIVERRTAVNTSFLVRQVASRILSLALDATAPHRAASDTYFWKTKVDGRVSELATALGLRERNMRVQFDGVIHRWNGEAHLGPISRLDREVAELMSVMTPEVRLACKWECCVLEGYCKIKRIFRTEFA